MDPKKAINVYKQMEKSLEEIKQLETLLLEKERDEIVTSLFTLCSTAERAISKARDQLYHKVLINNK